MMLRFGVLCVVVLVAHGAVMRQQSKPWTLIQKASIHVSDSDDNSLRFEPQEDPFEVQWKNFKNTHSEYVNVW